MIQLQRILLALLPVLAVPTLAQVPLSEKAFRQTGSSMGTVIVHVNWGRYWKCGPYENAQLQRLTFERLSAEGVVDTEETWELSPSSTLLVKPDYVTYAVLVNPGEYGLVGFRFKVAASTSDVRVAEPGPSDLVVDGKPLAGSFTLGPGEVVYIGHFGVDCEGEPTPWRFYVDGKEEFAAYVRDFHDRFPFMRDRPVTFRLFKTEQLGQPYDLPK